MFNSANANVLASGYFMPYISGTKVACGYKLNGDDLSELFQPYASGGESAPVTGFLVKQVNDSYKDLNLIFAKYVTPTNPSYSGYVNNVSSIDGYLLYKCADGYVNCTDQRNAQINIGTVFPGINNTIKYFVVGGGGGSDRYGGGGGGMVQQGTYNVVSNEVLTIYIGKAGTGGNDGGGSSINGKTGVINYAGFGLRTGINNLSSNGFQGFYGGGCGTINDAYHFTGGYGNPSGRILGGGGAGAGGNGGNNDSSISHGGNGGDGSCCTIIPPLYNVYHGGGGGGSVSIGTVGNGTHGGGDGNSDATGYGGGAGGAANYNQEGPIQTGGAGVVYVYIKDVS